MIVEIKCGLAACVFRWDWINIGIKRTDFKTVEVKYCHSCGSTDPLDFSNVISIALTTLSC